MDGLSSEPSDRNSEQYKSIYQQALNKYLEMTKEQMRTSRKPARVFIIKILLKSCLSAVILISLQYEMLEEEKILKEAEKVMKGRGKRPVTPNKNKASTKSVTTRSMISYQQ